MGCKKYKHILELSSKTDDSIIVHFNKIYYTQNEIAEKYYFEKYAKTKSSVTVNFLSLQKKIGFPHFVFGKTKIFNVDEVNDVLAKNNKPILKKRGENEKIPF